ncbi:unnamed protein product [Protopolystoma xenopodis]|uniref:Uncharacterized protein n=1 Tax=Protopolystoma xenopodis TaxID=117903 RepID=A0A3S5AXJ1_9PLAT|nr:unnamed protein product [Protopolystoma xenopodis]
MVDLRYFTYSKSETDTWAYFMVNLAAYFSVSLISLVMHNDLDDSGLGVPFDVYVQTTKPNRCIESEGFPWNVCAKNIMFTSKGQRINLRCNGMNENVTKIFVSRGGPDAIPVFPALKMSELQIYGVKTGEFPRETRW